MTVATFLLLVYGLLLALLAGSIVVTTGRRLTARRRLRLVSSRRRDGGWPPLPWPLPPPPAPRSSRSGPLDFLHRTDAETWARENPRTAEATGVIALLAQRDALRARVAALEAERDRLDCTRREGGDTRHCRLDAKCQRCQSEAERDGLTDQCASAERALNQACLALDAIALGPQGDDSYSPQGHREAVEAARAALAKGGDRG